MSMIEVPAAEQRDIQVVTTEIRTLVSQYRRITVAFAVEIGRRLTEAKSLLPHGEWGNWLREQVEFSPRTATNFMRVFEEYGDAQITLFGAVPKRQALADLPITKALQLLALPDEERESFAAENDVERMSTRELHDAIRAKMDAERDRDAAIAERDEAAARAQATEEKAEALRSIRNQLSDELERVRIIAEKGDPKAAEAAKLEAKEAKKRAEELAALLEQAQNAAKKAKEDEKKAKEKIKALKEHPEIPQEAADKLRAEGAAEAEKKAAAALERAKKAAEKAKKDADAAAEKAAALEKQLATAAPELVEFKSAFGQVQGDIDRLQAAFGQVQAAQPETAEKLKAAVAALADKMKGW